MLKKILAAFVAVAMMALSLAPAAEAQSRRHPRARSDYWNGSPVQRVVRGNMSITDGLFNDLNRRMSMRHGYPMGFGSRYGGFGGGYGFGYDSPYYYGGYDYLYDGSYGWRYRRHNTRETLQTIGTVGALVLGGIALSKASKAQKKAEVAAAPPVLREVPEAMPTCAATQVVNHSSSPAFIGELGGRGLFLQSGQAVNACLTPADCAYKQVDNSLVPADVTFEGDAVVIR